MEIRSSQGPYRSHTPEDDWRENRPKDLEVVTFSGFPVWGVYSAVGISVEALKQLGARDCSRSSREGNMRNCLVRMGQSVVLAGQTPLESLESREAPLHNWFMTRLQLETPHTVRGQTRSLTCRVVKYAPLSDHQPLLANSFASPASLTREVQTDLSCKDGPVWGACKVNTTKRIIY